MEYKEIIFNNRSEASGFIQKLNERAYSPLDWANSETIQFYGCIFPDVTLDCLFVCGETITPAQIEKFPQIGVFANIRAYGSSKKYKGLRNIKGETILSPIYDELTLFYQTEETIFIKTEKDGLSGLASYRPLSDKVDIIMQPKYDDIFDAGEFTFGFIANGKVGFASLTGREIIKARYKEGNEYNHFLDGKALVYKDSKFAVPCYINHYGEIVGLTEKCNSSLFRGNGTGYYPYGELPDALDAYEGDESNRWNTD